ncbi:hypothetical protein CGRA01v4_10834 [Colletotrichum graminicola]|uniref:C2H2-type domain-containing protein n=1 Tax=Colletotrichum graminicola (strain M1.001 / M2 / FGSC 10212) TaxID=645133 RepID=E3QXD7_COLGM|nr:uncharacterized protein GLRG_10669 [Colletotrichum graminicola M1.001]EFQ35525.1 hypothetical protein GLRG_10669 [Colletotrichum graminicola M1.001]WDK19547.1 hypothetical protein CGRA01v4_10834 [Colletotrichum graminicola]
MAIMQQTSALNGKSPQRMKGVNKHLHSQGAYTFLTTGSRKHTGALMKNGNSVDKATVKHEPSMSRVPRSDNEAIHSLSSKYDHHTLLGQKLQSIPEGFALGGFSQVDGAAGDPIMPLGPGNIRIPANLVNSFILVDAGPTAPVFELPQAPEQASSTIARAFELAYVDKPHHSDHHGYAMPSGSHGLSANHLPVGIKDELVSSELIKPASLVIPAAVSDAPVTNAAAPKAATKQGNGIDSKRGHDNASDSSGSTTPDASSTSNEDVDIEEQNDDENSETTGEEAPEDSGHDSSDGESPDGDSSDEESSDESSDEEDDATPGLARVRALNLPPGLAFVRVNDGKTRWPCNQCHRDWSRRDETRRHLRNVHYPRLYNRDIPIQKGLEQARLDCP